MSRDDLVILGDHYDSQMQAIEHNASCIVVCSGFTVSEEIIRFADKRDCVVIGTPYDIFTAADKPKHSNQTFYDQRKADTISH